VWRKVKEIGGNYNFVLIRTTWVEYMGSNNKKVLINY
jgi:hypothetical protein